MTPLSTHLLEIVCSKQRLHKSTVLYIKPWCLKKQRWLLELRPELAGFFHRTPFFRWYKHWQTNYGYSVLRLGKYFLRNKVNLSLQVKRLMLCVANNKIQAFTQNLHFGKSVCTTVSSVTSQPLKTWWDHGVLTCDFFILYNEMSPDLEELCTFVKQNFPNDLCMMLQNHEWVKKNFVRSKRKTNGF